MSKDALASLQQSKHILVCLAAESSDDSQSTKFGDVTVGQCCSEADTAECCL
jgi:hypothetical protein